MTEVDVGIASWEEVAVGPRKERLDTETKTPKLESVEVERCRRSGGEQSGKEGVPYKNKSRRQDVHECRHSWCKTLVLGELNFFPSTEGNRNVQCHHTAPGKK